MHLFQQELSKQKRMHSDDSVMDDILTDIQKSLVNSPPWWQVLEEVLIDEGCDELYLALSRFLPHTACLSLSVCLSTCPCLPVRMSVCSRHFVYLSVRLSLSFFLSFFPTVLKRHKTWLVK